MHTGNCDGSDPSEQSYLRGITNDQAQELLRSDVASAEQTVNSLVTVPLTQAQFDALVDFTYNVGAGNFERSDLLTKLNAGQYDAVPQELDKYVYGGGKVLPGLVTRRSDEGTLFQSEGNPEPVSSSYQGSNTLGERVATTQGLNVRSEPGTSSQVITTEVQGATGTIKDGPTFQDGYWWWQVNFDDGTTGWSADNWLSFSTERSNTVTNPDSGSSGTATNADSNQDNGNTGSNTLGERVVTTQGLHVRSAPGTSSNVITTEAAGTTGTITSGPTFQDDYWWWQVSFDDGTIGWSAENWLGSA